MNDKTKQKTKTKAPRGQVGDYLIARDPLSPADKPRFLFVKVKKVDEDSVEVWDERDNPKGPHRDVLDVPNQNVLINLGPNPPAGKVYGQDVGHRFLKTIEHDFWGPIHFFVKLEPEQLKTFRTALDRTATVIQKLKLEGYADKFFTEVRAKKGKYAGMYLHSKEDGQSRVWYSPEWAQDDPTTLSYVILHEFGHVLRYHGLTNTSLRAKWLKLYNKSVAKNIVDKKTVLGYWDELVEYRGSDDECSFAEALKAVAADGGEEDTKKNLSTIIKWFKQIHRLDRKDLEILWSAGDLEHLEGLWPNSSLDISKLDPLVSEYALKNVEELFAESFAFYANKTKLPEKVTALLEKSLSLIRNNV